MANELLDQIHKEMGLGEDKVVRDAAGKVIGAVKAQVVRDPSGKIVGEVGPAPEVDEGPTAHELIEQGLRLRITEAEKAMAPIVEVMAGHAKAVRVLKDRASQWDFKGRQEADAKEADLRVKFEECRKQLHELRKDAGMYSQYTPFLKAVDAFVNNLERHFTENPPFVLNRF